MVLLKNDSIKKHPAIRPYPTDETRWKLFLDALDADRAAGAFSEPEILTPAWDGFSSDPSGTVKYMYTNDLAVLWFPTTLTGTSDSTSFSITNLPTAIQPASTINVQYLGIGQDNGTNYVLGASILAAAMNFFRYDSSGTHLGVDGLWTGTGTKGVLVGAVAIYPIL